ncbi:MAG: heme lyase CcmF/NrfE family subunit [Pseudomonadota bacterium]|nr:heme lyase CcmF/NrfE family subunit [Pseudomonadota bacterium]
MFIESGHYALILALIVACMQGTLPLAGAVRGYERLMATARPAALLQFFLVALAFATLTYAYITSDFSVLNVAANSHSAKPLLYKITGVWGNHEGSMLLWVLILSGCGAALALFPRTMPALLRTRALGIHGLLGAMTLLYILVASSPFVRLPLSPADGQDLNPLLQDPGLAFHPPFLYLGYVGFSVPFSLAIAALLENRADAPWVRLARPWTLVAWISLTLGIALGSWWAYYELGWGGWWFWDPVENASLLPWLCGTALVHSLVVTERRNALKAWTLLLALITFGLSLLGTFLVRSGIITSVHAFATDPARGLFILAILALTMGSALTLYALRAPRLDPGPTFPPVSREGAILLNNLLLSTAAATILLGTLYPLLSELLGLGSVTVGPPWFTITVLPLLVPMALAVGAGPFLAWKRGDLRPVLQSAGKAALLTLAITLGTAYALGLKPVLAIAALALGVWILACVASDAADRIHLFRAPVMETLARVRGLPLSFAGMTLAHAGLGIAIIGMAGSLWTSERIVSLRPGQTVDVAGYTLVFEGYRTIPGPNWLADQGTFRVKDMVATLYPEKRWYPVASATTTEAAIHTGLSGNIYVALGNTTPEGAWTVRVWHHPLVVWIWAGAGIMAAGGAVSLAGRRTGKENPA